MFILFCVFYNRICYTVNGFCCFYLSKIALIMTKKEGRTRLLGTGHLLVEPGWHIDGHRHSFHELIVVVRGNLHVIMDGARFTGVPGDVFFYRAGVVHEESSDKNTPLETWYIAFNEKAAAKPMPARVRDGAGRIREMTRWLYEEWTVGPDGGKLQNALLRTIIAEWERLKTSPENAMVKRVRDRMAGQIDRKVTLGELANTAELSKYHFVRTYRRLTGRTPMKDLQSMRVKHARYLILATNLSQKEIARQSGLGDVYYLSRIFHRHFGTSPGALRPRGKNSRF